MYSAWPIEVTQTMLILLFCLLCRKQKAKNKQNKSNELGVLSFFFTKFQLLRMRVKVFCNLVSIFLISVFPPIDCVNASMFEHAWLHLVWGSPGTFGSFSIPPSSRPRTSALPIYLLDGMTFFSPYSLWFHILHHCFIKAHSEIRTSV